MKYFLILTLGFSILLNASALAAADEDIDFSLANLTLTAGDEKDFQYTFNLTNSGTSEVRGYSMKLTFSADMILDDTDTYVIIVPLSDGAAQWIGPNQTLLKTEHYYASSPLGYLPVGSWYIFAEINYDGIVPETDYTNNTILSTNQIVVADYSIPYPTPPTVSDITESSFKVSVSYDGNLVLIYYKVQASGLPAPDATAMADALIVPEEEFEFTVSGLGPAFAYDIYFIGRLPNGYVTEIYKTNVTTSGSAAPTLILSESNLVLSSVSKNNDSSPASYTITGFHITSNVVVSGASQMVVSKDDVTYSPQVSFPAAEFINAASKTIYVKYLTDGSTGIKTENISNTSNGATEQLLPVSVAVFDPANSNFNNLTSLWETGWSEYDVIGDQAWSLVDLAESPPEQRTQATEKAMQIDGAINGFIPNEDWLISPELNFSGFEYEPTIKFRSFSSGDGATLQLKYSADYSGSGDPRLATWFDTDVEFPAVNSNEWKSSSTVVLNKESKIFFAFVYTSTETSGTRWTIDDWSIKDNLLSIPSTILTYADVEIGTSSVAQSLFLQIAGYGDITVTASEGFQVSLDNTTFDTSVVIPEIDAEAGRTIYVRFTPTTAVQGLHGTLTFTSTDLSVVREDLVGSTLNATAISKALETSNFIYPNPTNGPVHIDAYAFYTSAGDVPVSIANSMGSTVANFASSAASLEANLSDAITNLSPGLYYVTIQTDKAIFRNKLVRE
jgi:hypothetical protein